MNWWLWLLLTALLLVLPVAAALLLPLRIFVQYLREDKIDRLSLRIRQGGLQLRLETEPGDIGGSGVRWRLSAGPLGIAASSGRRGEGRRSRNAAALRLPERWKRELLDLAATVGRMALVRQERAQLKRITLSHFNLELSWGGEDPALTAIAAGGCHALGALLTALLTRYFTLKSRPRFQVEPQFGPAGLRLRWEGEAVLSLYRLLSLRRMLKIIGGVAGGASSH